jgi:hypothetical protein
MGLLHFVGDLAVFCGGGWGVGYSSYSVEGCGRCCLGDIGYEYRIPYRKLDFSFQYHTPDFGFKRHGQFLVGNW